MSRKETVKITGCEALACRREPKFAFMRTSFVILYLLLIMTPGRSQKIDPAHPDLSPGNFRLDSLPESEINIPIQIYLRPLFKMAEKYVDTVFTSPGYPDNWVQEGCDTRYKYVFRRGPLAINGSVNTLTLGFTGYYKIIGSTRVCVQGAVISPWTPPCKCGFGTEGERKVDVSFLSSFGIEPDYKLKLYTLRKEPFPKDKCEVCFWGQDITKQVMKGLKEELDAAKVNIDKTYGVTDLRSRMQQVWDQLNKNFSLYGLGWLQINPSQFRINKFAIEKDSLNISLGLTARPRVSFEQPIEIRSKVPPLAPTRAQKGFSIVLDAMLSYDSLGKILNSKLAGKEFDFKKGFIKKKFILDSCQIYGGGFDKMVIKINFSGTNTGIFYLVGRPMFDPDKRMLEIKEVDFDIKSKNILLGSADWLFDKKITKEIIKQSRFDLGAYIDSAKITMNQQLNTDLAKGVHSVGNIQNITLSGIFPMQNQLIIRSKCEGELAVRVNAAEFSL